MRCRLEDIPNEIINKANDLSKSLRDELLYKIIINNEDSFSKLTTAIALQITALFFTSIFRDFMSEALTEDEVQELENDISSHIIKIKKEFDKKHAH